MTENGMIARTTMMKMAQYIGTKSRICTLLREFTGYY
jgi:hypothetical protein